MMRKMYKIGAVILAAGLTLSVSGCSGKTSDSVKVIQEAGVFKVAIIDSDNYFTRLEGNTPVGMEPELVETISAALGTTTEYQVLTENAALEAVASGTADIAIGCISGSEALSENYRITTSYGKGFYYVVTEKGDYAQSAGAFSNSVVGINSRTGDDTRRQLYAAEGIAINEYTNTESAAKDIIDGRIRAYVCMEEEAKALIVDPNLQVQNIYDVDPAEYVIVAGSDDHTLVNGMNTMIAQFLTKE